MTIVFYVHDYETQFAFTLYYNIMKIITNRCNHNASVLLMSMNAKLYCLNNKYIYHIIN